MGTISTQDARGLYTKMLVSVYSERKKPTSFLRSFFRTEETDTKEVSIEVQRGTEKIAVDVERGTIGNRNSFNRSTEKIFVPPYYREYFDVTELDLYDRLFNDTEIDAKVLAKFIRTVADKLRLLQDKIERSIEKQCAEVFETGIVVLASGDVNINFGRKAASLVDSGTGEYWADSGVDPYAQIETDIKFIREQGMSEGSVFNLILGATAISDLYDNTKFKARQNLFNLKLDAVAPPQAQSVGGTLHGEMSVGPYRVRLWTYEGYYKNSAGTVVPYVNPKKYFLVSETPEFVLAFAAVPQLLQLGTGNSIAIKKGAFIFGDYIDERQTTHVFDVKSAPIAIPVSIDQMVTRQVVS
jgi:hypothetical protein